jgi:hypothetical protein
MTSGAKMAAMARRHLLTFRDVYAPGEAKDNALPITTRRASFRVRSAAKPFGRAVTAMVRLHGQDSNTPIVPELWVNSILCPLLSQLKNEYAFSVPEQALVEQDQVVEVADKSGATITVEHVEFDVAAAEQREQRQRK